MKKRILRGMACLLLATMIMASCQLSEPSSENLGSKIKAIQTAKSFLKSENVMISNSQWAVKAQIVQAYPLYLDGIDEESYYECKVKVDGKDAGYIIVNVNNTDAPVLEYSVEGRTTTEEFEAATKISAPEMKIFRYNTFEYIAEEKSGSSKSGNKVLAQIGIIGNGEITAIDAEKANDIAAKRKKFREKVKENQCSPSYTAESIKALYEGLSTDTASKGETRWFSDELNNTFSSGWHLPKWQQSKVTIDGVKYSIGCSPTAVAMCYAYWRQFKGKTKLFGGANLNNYDNASDSSKPTVYNAVREIAIDMGTEYRDDGLGHTSMGRSQETKIDDYGDNRSYSFECDVDFGGDWAKGKSAYGRIKGKDQPIAVSMNTEDGRLSNHTVAIEGVKYKEYKRLLTWLDREMWLLMNYGWGNKRTWVCTYNRLDNSAETETTGFFHIWD